MLLGGTLDVGLVRIEDRVRADGGVGGGEEVGQVDGLVFLVREGVTDLLGAACRHIPGFLDVADDDVRTAHEVDPVAGGLGVLRILRDHPAVEPHGEAFLREGVAEFDAEFGGLFDGPHAVTAPGEVHVPEFLDHLVLAEIGFPAGHEGLHLLHVLFHGGDVRVGGEVHQLVHRHLAFGDLLLLHLEDELRVDVAGGVLDEDAVGELRILDDVPGGGFLVGHVLGVVQDAGGAPHVAHGVIVGVLALAVHLVEAGADVRGQVLVDVVGRAAEVTVQGQQEVVLEHPFDDVVGRAHDVVVLMALLDLGEHRLVDVEGLVDDLHFFAGLLFVPLLELGNDFLVDVVGPVINLEDLGTVLGAAGEQGGGRQGNQDFFHLFSLSLLSRSCRMLMIIRRMRTTRKIRVISGRSSGVRPPLRASV